MGTGRVQEGETHAAQAPRPAIAGKPPLDRHPPRRKRPHSRDCGAGAPQHRPHKKNGPTPFREPTRKAGPLSSVPVGHATSAASVVY